MFGYEIHLFRSEIKTSNSAFFFEISLDFLNLVIWKVERQMCLNLTLPLSLSTLSPPKSHILTFHFNLSNLK